jgi:thiamine-phosphate pyrophosphorylase
MLLFTPELCGRRDPYRVLDSVLDSVDVVQVRPKPAGSDEPCAARDAREACLRVIELLGRRPDLEVLVIVDDRVDVALDLAEAGCDGVHLGQDDCPSALAREILGPAALIGLSTHDAAQIGAAWDLPVDYLGFGPVHATATKGRSQGLGPEAAWIASAASRLPVFPIGGIDATNAADLSRIGRAAVGSAILGADRPDRAARELRALLAG